MGLFTYQQLLVISALLSSTTSVGAVDRSKFRTCHDTGFCKAYREQNAMFKYALDKTTVTYTDGRINAKISEGSGGSPDLDINLMFYSSGTVRVKITGSEERWQPTDLLLERGLQSGRYTVLTAGDGALPVSLKSVDPDSFIAASFESFSSGVAEPASVVVVHTNPMKIELYKGNVLQVTANDRSLLHFEQQRDGNRKLIEQETENAQESEEDRHGGKVVVDYGEDGLAIYDDGSVEERRQLKEEDSSAHHHTGSVGSDQVLGRKGDNFGGHHDSMPLGARSVGIDFAFPYAQNVYGIPEHTSPLSLPTTTTGSAGISPHYKEPYRLYNLDVFEYELDNTMALYGHIPLMLAHSKVDSRSDSEGSSATRSGKGMTSGVFWFNPSETFIDISDGGSAASPHKESHWMSESGEVDFFLLSGPQVSDVYRQYTMITGTQQLPPLFSLGYHQCRWNYRDEKDVATVESTFEELDYPVDVIWLDIEHTDGKRYFTWDKRVFPNPIEMQHNVSKHGRKMVTIVDPHLKRDDNYFIHKEATAKSLYVKNKDGGNFDGWCWPGSSSYLDFTSPHVRQWWAEQFNLDKYIGSTMDLFTWNDMNEPSVFNGPEVSMPKDAKNLEGVEHREWHNLYGIYMQMATALGLTQRSISAPAPSALSSVWKAIAGASSSSSSPDNAGSTAVAAAAAPVIQRPFVLTRAFWAGSQRHGAMWTGDNSATWGHLKIAAPMLLSINLAGLSFSGSDVGGFFGEPGAELFTRWYQAGAFTPFFRGHAHHDTKRREPWVFGEPYTSILRSTAMLRYSLLPYWYSTFYSAYSTGMPVMRPMFFNFPDDEATFKMDDQWMVGDSLLVHPVTDAGAVSAPVYFPDTGSSNGVNWYKLETLAPIITGAAGQVMTIDAPLAHIPAFIRAGGIIPRKMRLRRSSKLMFFDPITLVIAPKEGPDSSQRAEGTLYLDDEFSLAHETQGSYAVRRFAFTSTTSSNTAELKCSALTESVNTVSALRPAVSPSPEFVAPNSVERVQIAGQKKEPRKVSITVAQHRPPAGLFHLPHERALEEGVSQELTFSLDVASQVLTIKKPMALVTDDWVITLEY